ncbi:type IX secretion system outer membrane channel protein PorV [Pseudoflavitalea sp. X16]|uniref:type IX secretion system outer membrane channel protein PorV n=1 Tax=Paraflavitalea devenefica TaxID=2716334 RepID=UPI00141F5441|nr:type IX secretion system outer membrane channel protein PorV [Paraflavitalea devenefica]NII28839.1 type IX secretion system outer membrane channel protein PorV [Paraflavitalea devenefica]
MQQLYRLRPVIFVLLMIIITGRLQAQEGNNSNTINITTTAVPFLRISPDARSGGMGDVGIALSPDANSGFYNLAKIPFATGKAGIGATYTPWLKEIADDVYLATLAGYYKLDENQALSASLRYFSMGDLALVDYNGNKLQTSNPREMAIDVGYSRKLSDKFGIAAALRYIHSNLSTGNMNGVSYKAGNTVAGDLSIFYNGLNDKSAGWTAGLSLSNLGGKIGYTDNSDEKDFLPANLGIGAAYTEAWDDNNKMTFAADINKLLVPELPDNEEGMKEYHDQGVVGSWFDSFGNKAWQFGFGMEYTYNDMLHLRLGYNSKTYESGNWQNITAGAGIRFSFATVNFSYLVPTGDKINRNPLTNTVRFGILFDWK